MAKPKIEKEVVSFRIKSNYIKTFRKACEISGVRMSDVLESLMFSWLKTYGDQLEDEKEIEKIINDVYDKSNKLNSEVIEG